MSDAPSTTPTAVAPPTREARRRGRAAMRGVAAAHGAHNVRVFGSVARGDADEASDVDFLVDMEPDRSLLDLAGLFLALGELLGCRVDVATERGLRARLRDRVLSEATTL
jgi:predicted nucleotidyltransferase